MDKKYIITRQGKDFVLYEGLLNEAHARCGLRRISTEVLQIPSAENGNMAVVTAEVEVERGTFSGIGDANPGNVNRMIVPHLLRMAETRAKARALRDATDIGVTAAEELGDFDGAGSDDPDLVPAHQDQPAQAHSSDGQEGGHSDTPFPKASPYKSASANQLATIAKLSRLLGEPEEPNEDMTSAEASDRITDLSRAYNEAKGTTRRHA